MKKWFRHHWYSDVERIPYSDTITVFNAKSGICLYVTGYVWRVPPFLLENAAS